MNVLIVNDEQRTADIMKENIDWKQYGIDRVYVAYDAKGGMDCLREYPIDIMLCDVEMPGTNGIDLLRWARERKMEVECIFVSCHAKFEYEQAAISLGCQEYILIPAMYEDIGKTVQKVVDRIRNRKEERYYTEYGKSVIREQVRSEQEKGNDKISKEEMVNQITSFIRTNIANSQLSVEWIGEQFHFHPVYMNRIFKEKKGISMGSFITEERMKRAVALMEQGESNAFEIAQKVGYSQYSNFYVMFKKHYGISPMQYKDAHRKGETSES